MTPLCTHDAKLLLDVWSNVGEREVKVGELRGSRRARRARCVGACALLAAATSVFFASGAPAAKHAVSTSVTPVRQAYVLDIEETGVAAPVGLAFATRGKTFYVLSAPSSGSASPGTDVVMLMRSRSASVSSRAVSSHIAAAIQDPINIAFDARRSRMLFMGQAGGLLEAPVGANGKLDTAKPRRHDAALFGLETPRGMAVDPASGVVFIADANVPRIVRVEPQSDGNFDKAVTSELEFLGQAASARSRVSRSIPLWVISSSAAEKTSMP